MKNVKLRLFISATAVAGVMTISSFAGNWDVSTGVWRYMDEAGNYQVNGWVQDGGSWYGTDENGIMRTGWYQDVNDGGRWYYFQPEAGAPQGAMKTGWLNVDGKWYFLDTRIGGPLGSMLIGWQWIDGRCYYLDPQDGGAMIAGGMTPDGYTVDASGAWTDALGNPYYEVGKGISSTVITDISGNGGSASGAAVISSYTSAEGSGGGSGSSGGGSSSGTITVSGGGRSDSAWLDYDDRSVSHAANDFTTGNWGMMSADERSEVNDAIDDFKEQYITSDMSDFEKEIKIIEWLVENCDYQVGEEWENSTAYSCIINGEAQCAGYADAFLQTAKACGLNARYVYNTSHAWNLVELDGDWYHVDVTWEDPIGSNNYGFGNLRNKYINLEDTEIRTIRSHSDWSPSSIKANGVKYGTNAVANYMKTGNVDTGLDTSFEEETEKFYNSVDHLFEYENNEQTIADIIGYLSSVINKRDYSFEFVVRYPDKYTAGKTGNYSALVDINNIIEDSVNTAINDTYAGVLKNPVRISLYLKADADARYYAEENGNLYYTEGNGKKIEYVFNFIDVDGKHVGSQTGQAEKGQSIELNFPEGYRWISNEKVNYDLKDGKATYGGDSVYISGAEDVEMDIRLRQVEKKKEESIAENVSDANEIEEKDTLTESSNGETALDED